MSKMKKVMLTMRLYPAQIAEINANYEAFLKRAGHNISREEWMRKALLSAGRTGENAGAVIANNDANPTPWLPGLAPSMLEGSPAGTTHESMRKAMKRASGRKAAAALKPHSAVAQAVTRKTPKAGKALAAKPKRGKK